MSPSLRWQAFTGETAMLEGTAATFADVGAERSRRKASLMGRRAHKPDPAQRRQVEAMAAYGIPEPDISRVVGIDPKTLRKYYRDELDLGDDQGQRPGGRLPVQLGQERQRHGPDLLA